MIGFPSENLHNTIGDSSIEALAWRLDPEANSIALTAWYVGRFYDCLPTRILKNRPAEDEVWQTRGWSARPGYDPRDVGWGGFGALIGYTQAEVDEVPILPAVDLLA